MTSFEHVVQQLKLDHLAITASRVLAGRGVPHVLLKGATTSHWLYSPPRAYRDVDMLVPGSRLDAAVEALIAEGVARGRHGRLGEEGDHSLVLVSTMGAELDLHVTLPSLVPEPGDDSLWEALASHVEDFSIDGRAIPALDEPARCVVLALHVVASGRESEQVREDFRRARRAVDDTTWARAAELAQALGVTAHLAGAQALVDGDLLADLPAEVRLRLGGGSASAIQLARLSRTPLRRLPAALWAEAFPSRAFLDRMFPEVASGALSPTRARMRRLVWLTRSVPSALVELWTARRAER